MRVVEIRKRRFVCGLNWENYEDKERALEAVKDYRQDGLVAGYIKSGELYLVYSGEKIKGSAFILASGFLHLPPGAHTLPLSDGNYWLFVKGTDGGILLDAVLPEEEVSVKAYEYVDGEINRLTPEQIQEKLLVPYKAVDTEKTKKLLLVGASAVLLLLLAYIAKDMFFKKPSNPLPPPQTPVMQTEPVSQDQPPPPQAEPPKPVKINLAKCYENYYRGNPGNCEHEPTEDYISCEELQKTSLPIQYGQISSFDHEYFYYPLSLSGQFYYTELKPIERFTFIQDGLSATIDQNMNFTLQGVVICRR